MNGPEIPRRLLVRLPNWLGDAVMALPALVSLRRAQPETHLSLVGQASVTPVFEEQTGVDAQQIITTDRTNELQQLRAGEFDAVVLLTNSFRTAWTAARSRVPHRWGYAAGVRRPLLTRAVARPREEVHQAEYYLRLLDGLGFRADRATPRIEVRPVTAARADRVLAAHGVSPAERLVGFAPGAAYGHAKRWPPDRVAAVIARVTAEQRVRCVLVGSAADREAGRAIESSLPPDTPVVDLIGRTDLRLLMGVLRRCAAFVSNDSGAMHLAAALGIPVTALFGPTKARVTAPLGDHDILRHDVFCSPCMLRECPIDHRCMKRISVDEVYGAVARRIDAGV